MNNNDNVYVSDISFICLYKKLVKSLSAVTAKLNAEGTQFPPASIQDLTAMALDS